MIRFQTIPLLSDQNTNTITADPLQHSATPADAEQAKEPPVVLTNCPPPSHWTICTDGMRNQVRGVTQSTKWMVDVRASARARLSSPIVFGPGNATAHRL